VSAAPRRSSGPLAPPPGAQPAAGHAPPPLPVQPFARSPSMWAGVSAPSVCRHGDEGGGGGGGRGDLPPTAASGADSPAAPEAGSPSWQPSSPLSSSPPPPPSRRRRRRVTGALHRRRPRRPRAPAASAGSGGRPVLLATGHPLGARLPRGGRLARRAATPTRRAEGSSRPLAALQN
jgi:hypothetical protein